MTPPHRDRVPTRRIFLRRTARTALPLLTLLFLTALACTRSLPAAEDLALRITQLGPTAVAAATQGTPLAQIVASPTPFPTRSVLGSPTPNPTRTDFDANRPVTHLVQPGDTLGQIADAYGVTLESLLQANGLTLTSIISVGQELVIPQLQLALGPDTKLIPDAELVYGPTTVGFDIPATINRYGGYLARYTETDSLGITRTGAQIVTEIVQQYSVNPRLILALIEYRSTWLANPTPDASTLTYPLGYVAPGYEGLYRQLRWAANQLNAGFYGWRAANMPPTLNTPPLTTLGLADGSRLVIAPTLNPGTVGVQNVFARSSDLNTFQFHLSPNGFPLTYATLFGNPFQYNYEPLIPPDLTQPPLQWPWNTTALWYFTGGPHGGWDSGSPRSALDFAPPSDIEGCYDSPEWVRAAAAGRIVRSDNGAVLQDLDDDGYEQTGWVLFYMHIATNDRVAVGADLSPGDNIGHPSCEGGFSNGTHLHFARKFNGVWLAVNDPFVPFNIDGWTLLPSDREYDGWLVNGNRAIEACDCRSSINAMQVTP